jgi:hypothetical protein
LLTNYPIANQSHSFENVFWVDVGNQQAAEQGFMNISDHLKLQAQSFEQVVQYLSGTQHTWLLVLDNADNPATDFHPFFPSGSRGTVIMTSRNPECGQVYGTITGKNLTSSKTHWREISCYVQRAMHRLPPTVSMQMESSRYLEAILWPWFLLALTLRDIAISTDTSTFMRNNGIG